MHAKTTKNGKESFGVTNTSLVFFVSFAFLSDQRERAVQGHDSCSTSK
jgi:hypothetical protein